MTALALLALGAGFCAVVLAALVGGYRAGYHAGGYPGRAGRDRWTRLDGCTCAAIAGAHRAPCPWAPLAQRKDANRER